MEEWTGQLKEIIHGKWSDYLLSERLVEIRDESWEQECIRQIMNDEKHHYEAFQRLHHQITGDYFRFEPDFSRIQDYRGGLHEAQQKEIENYRWYRHMLLTAPSSEVSTPFYIAMTDDIGHAILFGTLIAAAN
ncbi:hypothetical protein [Salimicrobium halophilum]|uniref:Rubrerythrin n=1 Tax=Salimicrobium halophilum TaxID=86666 RepID=A0A1G8TMM2_9BACI|nr:hypothetical protein [Salimicrobium halophilum]SDJ42789.1 hypothetical protein SAMN04490247_1870 [Salimicrobium halophilum]